MERSSGTNAHGSAPDRGPLRDNGLKPIALQRALTSLVALACVLSLAGCGGLIDATIDAPVDVSLIDAGGGVMPPARTLQLESHMSDAINRERVAADVDALPIAYDVAAVAREHSTAMLSGQFFDHRDPQGRDPEGRLREAAVPFDAAGEVIGFTIARDGVVLEDLDAILATLLSADHAEQRDTILAGNWTQMGVGVAVASTQQQLYVTVLFIEYPGRVIGVRGAR